MLFLARERPRILSLLSYDEIDEVDCDPMAVVRSIRYRDRLLEGLTVAHPWVSFTGSDRAEIISTYLAPMMCDKQTSQQKHSLLASLLSWYVSDVDDIGLITDFAKEIHIMLEEGKKETWFYLDDLGALADRSRISQQVGFGHLKIDCILTVLQHLSTPVLLLETLERVDDHAMLGIVLKLMCCFAEHGILSTWDERMHDRLLSRLSILESRDTHIALIARLLATSDSRELSKLPLAFFDRIQTSTEKLTSLPQFRVKVTSNAGLLVLVKSWKEDSCSSPLFENKHLWGVFANLADWVAASTPHFCDFATLVQKKLREVEPRLARGLWVWACLPDAVTESYEQRVSFFGKGKSIQKTTDVCAHSRKPGCNLSLCCGRRAMWSASPSFQHATAGCRRPCDEMAAHTQFTACQRAQKICQFAERHSLFDRGERVFESDCYSHIFYSELLIGIVKCLLSLY